MAKAKTCKDANYVSYAKKAGQFHPNGGQFDFSRLPARAPRVDPQYVHVS